MNDDREKTTTVLQNSLKEILMTIAPVKSPVIKKEILIQNQPYFSSSISLEIIGSNAENASFQNLNYS